MNEMGIRWGGKSNNGASTTIRKDGNAKCPLLSRKPLENRKQVL